MKSYFNSKKVLHLLYILFAPLFFKFNYKSAIYIFTYTFLSKNKTYKTNHLRQKNINKIKGNKPACIILNNKLHNILGKNALKTY